jgi:Cu-processing system permease protein
MKEILLIAGQDLKLNLRNKWILGISILFGILTLAIAYSGLVTAGYVGFQDFRRTGASIVNLILYFIPIISLILGTHSFIISRGYLDLIVTQPVTRSKVIIGKYLGSLASLIAATSVGFGIAGLIISIRIGSSGSWQFMLVVLLSILLGAVFLSLGFLLAVLMQRRQSAVGLSLILWFILVVFYDLMVFASTVYLSHSTLKSVLFLALLFNPVDLIRVTSLIVVGGESMFGAAGVVAVKMMGSMTNVIILSLAIILLWVVVPLLLSIKLFKKQSL